MNTFQADRASTQYVDGTNSRFAYRRLGPRSGVPLAMAHRFRGTIDHWDPALLDVLATYAMSQRLPNAKVILYSDAGHAFLFQHAEEFGHEVLRFLR